MAAGVHNFTCEQGATFIRTMTLKDDADNARDLTGYSARMQVRRRLTDTTVVWEGTTGNGKIVLGASAGTVEITMTPTETGAFTRDGVYDLEIEDGSGVVERVLEGAFYLNLEVTRDEYGDPPAVDDPRLLPANASEEDITIYSGGAWVASAASAVVQAYESPTASASWGGIGGTLSDQSDLQSALDGKSDTTHNHDGTYDPAGSANAASVAAVAAAATDATTKANAASAAAVSAASTDATSKANAASAAAVAAAATDATSKANAASAAAVAADPTTLTDLTGILPIVQGGTGASAIGTDGQVATASAGAITWQDAAETAWPLTWHQSNVHGTSLAPVTDNVYLISGLTAASLSIVMPSASEMTAGDGATDVILIPGETWESMFENGLEIQFPDWAGNDSIEICCTGLKAVACRGFAFGPTVAIWYISNDSYPGRLFS